MCYGGGMLPYGAHRYHAIRGRNEADKHIGVMLSKARCRRRGASDLAADMVDLSLDPRMMDFAMNYGIVGDDTVTTDHFDMAAIDVVRLRR